MVYAKTANLHCFEFGDVGYKRTGYPQLQPEESPNNTANISEYTACIACKQATPVPTAMYPSLFQKSQDCHDVYDG